MYKEWLRKFCDTIMENDILEGNWCYADGVILKSMEYAYEVNKDERMYSFIKDYIDQFINEDGDIPLISEYPPNVDRLSNGKLIFSVYKHMGDERYIKPLTLIRNRITNHTRLDGCNGFAHKEVYYNQMWLDGIYMLQPLYAQFAKEWDTYEDFNDIAEQFQLITKFCYDDTKGLFYHAYDHSKSMFWADPVTGHSPNFWGRAMGWLAMATVETLDYFPEDHEGRKIILDVIDKLAHGIKRYQSKEGVWYQILDMGDREGNYLEASGSCMFAYFLKKCLMKGYIDSSYKSVLDDAMKGIFKEFVSVDDKGWVHMYHTCQVAGLGPIDNPRRDGTFEYYISEPQRDDDAKTMGAFLGVLALFASEENQ